MPTQLIKQSNLINPTQSNLENIDLRTDLIAVLISFRKLYHNHTEYFEELAEEMELDWSPFLKEKLQFTYNLLHLQPTDYHLFFDPQYHFNRYRLKTLRNSFYHDIPFFDLQKYRNFCRSKEKEAFKGGLTNEIWTNPMAEKILGEADEPGYFGGNGSPGWKLNAIANFCLDIHMSDQNLKFLRLSSYDSFMEKGQIELLGNSLKLRKNQSAIQKMLSRKLGYTLPQDHLQDEKTEE